VAVEATHGEAVVFLLLRWDFVEPAFFDPVDFFAGVWPEGFEADGVAGNVSCDEAS
jgi:hypothetical protein